MTARPRSGPAACRRTGSPLPWPHGLAVWSETDCAAIQVTTVLEASFVCASELQLSNSSFLTQRSSSTPPPMVGRPSPATLPMAGKQHDWGTARKPLQFMNSNGVRLSGHTSSSGRLDDYFLGIRHGSGPRDVSLRVSRTFDQTIIQSAYRPTPNSDPQQLNQQSTAQLLIMTNSPTEPKPTTVRKKTSDSPATAWDLAESLRPLPAVKRPPRKYQPKELRHYPAIVEYVYKSRFADRSLIQRRFSKWLKNERTARNQLACLVDLGYLGIATARVSSPKHFIYFATGQGVRLISEAWARLNVDWQVDTREENRERGRSLRTLVHELMLSELELAVRLTVDARADLKILTSERRYFRAENQLRFTYQVAHYHVEPDAGFVLSVQRPGSDPALLLHFAEMDRGWMSLRRITQKYLLYTRWGDSLEGRDYLTQLYGRLGAKNPQPNFRLLVIAHDALHRGKDLRRLAELFAQALDLPSAMRDRLWLTTVELLRAHQADQGPLAAPLWYRVRDARDWLADFRATMAARQPEQKLQAHQRKYVEGRLPSLPLHPLFPQPVAATRP